MTSMTNDMIKNEAIEAYNRIRSYIRNTYFEHSIAFSKLIGANVYFKCENLQYTGSFKVRGAFNKLLSLTPEERAKGIVTASSGNHGAGVAYGLHQLKCPGVIFVPENASKAKVENIQNYVSSLKYFGQDCMDTEIHARQVAEQNNMTYISPYNDEQVIAGQATIAIELMEQLPHIDAVFVPVGGGGLISGIGGYLKAVSPQTQVIGCMPENSPVMAKSLSAGQIVEMETLPTFSDATAGGIEPGSITFEICQHAVDDCLLVSEDEIKSAILDTLQKQHLLVEGAAGVALACLYKNRAKFQNKNVVVILSGSNISLDTLKKLFK